MRAFEGCYRLTVVTFASECTLSRIEEGCFCECSLTTVVLPRSVTFVHPTAFDKCVKIMRQEAD
jgi:hypothetical protein